MASGKSIKEYFGQFSVGTLAGAAGTLLASSFLTWWNWAAVKAFLASVGSWFVALGAWLMGTAEVYRVVILADFLVLAALLAWVALWWHLSRAVVPVSAPVVARPCLPADFNPTQLQRAITVVLMQRWQKQSDLQCVADLVEQVKPGLVPTVLARAHIARDLELLETANVVSIDRPGLHDAYYHLTPLGRNWIIQRMEALKDKAATGE